MPYAPEYLHLVIPDTRFEAWLYGRNSDDATGGGESVEAQLTTGRTFCRDYDWRILREFKDVGISASRHGTKARGDFEDLLDTIETTAPQPGVRRIVVAFEASRYYRNLEEYVRLRAACLRANVLLCYNGHVYDLSRRDDRKTTAQHAVDAEDEAEGIRDRNLRTTRLQAEAGEPHGKLPYGFNREYAFVNGRRRCTGQNENAQGTFVFQAIERADSGHSIRAIVRWLRGVPEASRPDGADWSEDLVRRMLLNRVYLGERAHHGTYRKATWDAIKGLHTAAGRAMFNRVTAKLNDPERQTQRGTGVVHLQSLIALCGECGDHAVLVSRPSTRAGTPTLYCRDAQNVAVQEALMDAYVEEGLIAWFSDKKRARAALVPEDSAVEERMNASQRLINGYEEQLRDARTLAETFDPDTGQPRLSVATLAALEQRLLPRLEAERRKLQAMTGVSPLLLSMLDDDPDLVWNGRPATETEPARPPLSLEQKREVLRKVVTVRLHKASRPGLRKLEPGRITLSFIGEPGFRARPLRAREKPPAQAPSPDAASGT
ncbi:recombinase family protein [Streptomyces silvensis]|uniref:recombinase family protein n=1 Tax=Streptomyces silvensis TaxID=1765722 RepID=UPI000A8A2173|nr:recombinase family protein [Streptomyces silvensis]